MRSRLACVLTVLLLACGSSVEPAPTTAPAAASVISVTAPAEVDCPAAAPCAAGLPLTIANGGDTPVTLQSITASRAGADATIRWDYPTTTVPAHGTWKVSPQVYGAGSWSVVVSLRDRFGAAVAARTTARVRDLAREKALAACDACHGTWGRWGMMQSEGCDCRTTDAGRVCHDASECEGDCLEPQVEDIDAESYRLVGRCSAHTQNFGCLARVRAGTHTRTAGRVRLAVTCVD